MRCCENCLYYVDQFCMIDINSEKNDNLKSPENIRKADESCSCWEYNEYADDDADV